MLKEALAPPSAALRRQLGRYVVVGLTGFAVQLGSFTLLVHAAGLPYGAAGFIAGCLALVNNFVLNRHWTFEAGSGRLSHQATSYAILSAAMFGVQLAVLFAMVTIGLPKVPAEVVSIATVVPINFVAQRRFSFRT